MGLNSGYLLKSFLLYLYAVSFLAKKFHYFFEDLDKKNHLKIERRIYYVNPISMRHFFCIAIRQGPLSNWTEHSIFHSMAKDNFNKSKETTPMTSEALMVAP